MSESTYGRMTKDLPLTVDRAALVGLDGGGPVGRYVLHLGRRAVQLV
jgi:hypothetical protein